MGDENMAEAVDNGTKSPDKSDNDVKEGPVETCDKTEDKTEEVIDDNNKTEEVKDDNKETVEVKDENKKTEEDKDDNKEEKEVTDNKEEEKDEKKEEAKSDAMEVDDVADANEQPDDKVAESADLEEAGSKKPAAKKSGGEKGKNKKAADEKKKNDDPKTPAAPILDRPVRERKSVERLVAIFELDAAKEFHVEKGRGTPLKDIPNVAYKLSRKKVADETLKLLHTVLFVKRGKALEIKSNVLRFSGFVWHENEEKQKAKVHEKLDKLNKEKLLEFCDLLDVPITKTTAKKEDVIAKLMDFLMAPHATTSELLAEKEQSSKGNKRKSANKKSASTPEATTPSKDSSKKRKRASKEQKETSETEDSEEEHEDGDDEHENENGGPAKSHSEEHVSGGESVDEEEEENSKKRKRESRKSHSKTESGSKTKSKKSNAQKKTPTMVESKSKDESQSQSQPLTKTFSRKKKDPVVDNKSLTSKKSASKDKTAKKGVKEETRKVVKPQPSDDELRAAIHETLKEADFNTATFLDILKLLNEQFKTDLTPRKASLKCMVKEELTKIADEDETGKEA